MSRKVARQIISGIRKRALPVKTPYHAEDPKPQRKTTRNALSRFEPEAQRPSAKTTLAKKLKPVKMEKLKKVIAKEIEERVQSLQPKVANEDGLYELSPLMGGAVESELQRLMGKIQQEFSEKPSSEAEKGVADKIKAEAWDNIKNALGLNVTKRILNVFNTLYVKIEFDRKPFGLSIQNFIRWLNCTAMKRLPDGDRPHVYIAQLSKVADFDRVVSAGVMRIGEIKGKITPFYKFNSCPSKIKTIYKVKKPVKEIEEEKKTKENNPEVKQDIKTEPKKTTETVAATKKLPVTKAENTKPIETPKSESTQTDITSEATIKPTPAKITPKKPNVKEANVGKTATAQPETVPKKEVTKINVGKTAPVKALNVGKTAPVKAVNASKNINVGKTVPQGKPVNKDTKVNAEKTKSAQNAVKSNAATAKTVPNKNEKTAVKSNAAVGKTNVSKNEKNKKKEYDFDVLNDEDILALMSDAIVLDECAGSDDE